MAAFQTSSQVVTVDGIPVRYECAGQGEPVVFVHGLSGSTKWWARNIPAIAQHYRVYLVDLPGFGAMRRYRRQFQLLRAPHWLDHLCQALGLESFSLVGHSMGGYVCMALAAQRPERVRHLVLVASIGIPFERSVAQLVWPTALALLRTTPAFWPTLLYDGLRAGTLMILRAAHQIVALDARPLLPTLRTPTLLIWGAQDDLVPLSFGRQLHAAIPGAHLYVIERANHICMYDQPQLFNQALLTFLQGQAVGEPAPTSTASREPA
ncbi:alpha/beta fold hydrolase [Thermogemmatispora sp.]|uniref:alpha/beta fold hydrolase n=1 Tax=Thermogemmatispora sp. TaxID=1968838 RepID=UPI0035E42D59